MNDACENLTLPPIINLGIVRGACQCRCIHCPVGRVQHACRPETFGQFEMSCDTFSRFCEDIRHHDTTVRLHAVGEPTLHSRFHELLQIITGCGLQDRFWLFTNGLFPTTLLPRLVDSLGIIEVSVNSVDSEDYRRTKGVDRFADVVGNIRAMRRLASLPGRSPRILLTRVASDDDDDEAFTDHWRAQGFECFVRSYHSYSGILDSRGDECEGDASPAPKCLVPWRRLNLDGTLQPKRLTAVHCFNVLFHHPASISPRTIMGQYPDSTLMELWNNSRFGELRHRLTNTMPTGTRCDGCQECLTDLGPRSEGIVNHTNILC